MIPPITAQLIVNAIICNRTIYYIISVRRLTYLVISISQDKICPFLTIIIKYLYRQFTRGKHRLIEIELINNSLTTPHLFYFDNSQIFSLLVIVRQIESLSKILKRF